MDTETQALLDNQSPAFRAAKKKAKPKPKKAKAKAKKAVKKVKVKKPKAKPAKKAKKATPKKVDRPCRLDMRLSRAENANIDAKAKKLRRTRTSIVLEAIEKIK